MPLLAWGPLASTNETVCPDNDPANQMKRYLSPPIKWLQTHRPGAAQVEGSGHAAMKNRVVCPLNASWGEWRNDIQNFSALHWRSFTSLLNAAIGFENGPILIKIETLELEGTNTTFHREQRKTEHYESGNVRSSRYQNSRWHTYLDGRLTPSAGWKRRTIVQANTIRPRVISQSWILVVAFSKKYACSSFPPSRLQPASKEVSKDIEGHSGNVTLVQNDKSSCHFGATMKSEELSKPARCLLRCTDECTSVSL